MDPLYGILYVTFTALSTATWAPPPPPTNSVMMATALPPTPPLTIPKPPTAFFRQLLRAEPKVRQQLLNEHSAAQQRVLRSKLQQYEAMAEEQCDHQLRALELRWYLAFLMRHSPTERAVLLRRMPAAERALVERRLQAWDQFSPELQESILEHEMAIRVQYSLPLFPQTLTNLPLVQQQKIASDIARWKALPAKKQQIVYWSFKFMFDPNDPPQPPMPRPSTVLPPFPVSQKVAQFKQLPLAKRNHCLDNFKKFKQLPQAQRQRFLVAAVRWSKMSERERQAWRQAIQTRTTPPLPPRPNDLSGLPPLPFIHPQPVSQPTNR